MPRRKIREYQAKRLFSEHFSRLSNGVHLGLQCAQITPGTNFDRLAVDNPWLSSTKLVVKPDMLFGKAFAIPIRAKAVNDGGPTFINNAVLCSRFGRPDCISRPIMCAYIIIDTQNPKP